MNVQMNASYLQENGYTLLGEVANYRIYSKKLGRNIVSLGITLLDYVGFYDTSIITIDATLAELIAKQLEEKNLTVLSQILEK